MAEPAKKRRKLSDTIAAAIETVQDDLTTEPASTVNDVAKTNSTSGTTSLFVRNLASTVDNEKLVSHFSSSFPLKHATVVLDPSTKLSKGFGFVTFTDAEDAKAALTEFNGSQLEGKKIRVELAESRQRDIADGVEGVKKRAVNTKGEELRAKRKEAQLENQPPKLIIRNLPWSIKTPEDLSKLFQSYGKVKHAVVPKLPGQKGQAGFGIVILRGKKNAEAALKGVNGKEVDGRTLAVDWAVDKDTWQKAQQEEKAQDKVRDKDGDDGDVIAGGGSAEDMDDNVEEDNLESVNAGSAALDDGEDVDDMLDEEDEQASLDEEDIDELADDKEEDAEHGQTTGKFNTENTTVFIRNLPYDATDDDLHEHFTKHFGGIRYARVVYDQETERPRGTAFVCFRSETDARDCVKNCPKQTFEHTSQSKAGPSILQNTNADPTGKYTLNTRLLQISRAIPKGEADRRADDSAASRKEKAQNDKRRLYLLSEGTVSTGSALHSSLSATDLAVRQQSQRQRQKLVKANPNLGLSLTRLSIRNLPRFVDGKALKSLAREAIVGFATDVKEGKRQPISKEELARDGLAGQEAEKNRKAAGKGVVRQAKIVYESELNGGKVAEGKGGRSRGYGFVEYWGHRSALMGLRWLNGRLIKREDIADPVSKKGDNTEEDGERGKRLIVEFAIENAQVVQRRADRERKDKVWRDRRAEAAENGEELESKPKRSFEHKSQMDRKRKRENQDEDSKKGKKVSHAKKDQKTKKPELSKQLTVAEQEDKNKLAARNRIIAQKRQKRRNR